MSPPQHRLAAGALLSATRAVELGTSCVATRRGQQGKLRGPESTPTALLARANWATCDEVNQLARASKAVGELSGPRSFPCWPRRVATQEVPNSTARVADDKAPAASRC